MVDWASMFEMCDPRPGCSDGQLRELALSVARPLDAEETAYLSQRTARSPYPPGTPEHAAYVPPDPRGWPWPSSSSCTLRPRTS